MNPSRARSAFTTRMGRRETYLEQDAARAAEKSKSKVYRSTVVVRRLGEVHGARGCGDSLREWGDASRETGTASIAG